jgi:hypothetical protein
VLDQWADTQMNHLDDILNYAQSDDLVLNSYVKTTGIVETSFVYKDVNFTIFDTGGQRTERKKWINCYEDANVVLVVGALSQFNEVCYEDNLFNRMVEALEVVEYIGNVDELSEKPMYLYLNKQDIFVKELKKDTIKMAFPDCPDELIKLHRNNMLPSPMEKNFSWKTKLSKNNSSFSLIKKPGKNFNFLSEDELSYILTFLNYKAAVRLSTVNSGFYDALNNDYLWRVFALRYDPMINEKMINDAYDFYSQYPPWKQFFYVGKSSYFIIRDYIVKQFEFALCNQEFRSIYTTNATASDDSFNKIFESTLDDIISIMNSK